MFSSRTVYVLKLLHIAGALHIQNTFSWDKNKAEYDRLNALEINRMI